MPLPALSGSPSAEAFFRELRDVLHTLAQPLTLLQTRLAIASMLHDEPHPDAALLAALSEDVERACRNFLDLQTLVSSGKLSGEHTTVTAEGDGRA